MSRPSNTWYFNQKYHGEKIDRMATETERQQDAIQDEAERVQRVKPETILRKAAI